MPPGTLPQVVGRACSSAAASADAPARGGKKGSVDSGSTWRRSVLRALARPLPHNCDKTVGGTLACWLGGAAASLPLLLYFMRHGMFASAGPAAAGGVLQWGWPLVRGVLLCSGFGALAESLPLGGEADNVTIALAVGLCSRAYFGF